MESQGDDLTRPRDIDFIVVFPNEDSAQSFSNQFQRLGYRVSMEFAESVAAFPWDVIVVKHMAPSHQEISDFESVLQREAGTLGGRNDGWGCVSYDPDGAN
jgi:hypothetical protein